MPRHSRCYMRVLLAVYWLADRQGLLCGATLREIARAAGCSPSTAHKQLRRLEGAGIIEELRRGPGGRRTLLLLDHRDADLIRRSVGAVPVARAGPPGRPTRGT